MCNSFRINNLGLYVKEPSQNSVGEENKEEARTQGTLIPFLIQTLFRESHLDEIHPCAGSGFHCLPGMRWLPFEIGVVDSISDQRIQEKALHRLQVMKQQTSERHKAKQYVERLSKIPFGIYTSAANRKKLLPQKIKKHGSSA